MDELTTATPEVLETVETPTALPAVTAQPPDARRIQRTIEVVKGHPEAEQRLADGLGLMTEAQVNQRVLAEAAENVIDAYAVPAEWQAFIREAQSSIDMRARARQVQAAIQKSGQPAATTATQPTAEPAPSNQPIQIAPAGAPSTAIKSTDDAVAAYAARLQAAGG